MDKKEVPSGETDVIDLSTIREDLRIPTQVVAHLASVAGAGVVSARPGQITLDLPDSTVTIKIRLVNVYAETIETYRYFKLPVPDDLEEKARLWDKEHGKK